MEAGLHWNRAVDDTNALADIWLMRVRPYRAKAIYQGFEEYMRTETRFPVPGAVLPLIESKINPWEDK